MAQYILESKSFTAINETSGTLVNISNVPAEISMTEEFGTGIILFPRQHFSFAKQIYAARAPSFFGRAIIASIETGYSADSSSSEPFTDGDIDDALGDNTGFTDEDVDFVLDNGNIYPVGFTQADIDEVFKDDNSRFTEGDVDSVFDDYSAPQSGFTDDDIESVLDDDAQAEPNESFTQEDLDEVFSG